MWLFFKGSWCKSAHAASKFQINKLIHTTTMQKTLWPFTKHADFDAYDYSEHLSEPEPPELRYIRLAAMAHNRSEAQKMISPLQGAFMASIVRAQQAKVVLELGCYIGYSALWLAHGFRSNGNTTGAHLWTCERDTSVAYTAQKNIQMAGYQDTVTVMQQSADSVLNKWDSKKKIDLVFIDANKSAYKSYYDTIIDRELLQDGGQIIVDNVLFRGMVSKQSVLVDNINAKISANGEDQKHKKLTQLAQKLSKFNRHVAEDPRTTQIILPIFDGIMIIQRAQTLQ